MPKLTQEQVNLVLNQSLKKVYEAPTPELESTKLIPRGTNGISEGAESFDWDEMTAWGVANIVSRYAKDLPPVGFTSTKKYAGIHPLGNSYTYSFFDLKAAAFENKPLNTKMAVIARNAVLFKQDSLALEGDKKFGFDGFVNNPNVPLVAVPHGAWDQVGGSTSGDDVVDDIQAIFDACRVATKDTEKFNRAAIPASIYAKLNNKRISSAGNSPRILQYLKDTFPQIKEWIPSNVLETAGVNGGKRVVFYTYDENAVMNIVPMEFTQLPEQWAGLAATVNNVATSGGTVFFRPLSAAYADIA